MMADLNEIALGGAATPTKGQNPRPCKEEDSMSTITPPTNLPVPPGGEADQWIGDRREVYAVIGHVPVSSDLLSCPAVTVVAEQRADASLSAIAVHVHGAPFNAGLDVLHARQLASLIEAGADLADRWAARAGSCRYCTVPTDGGADVCPFCQVYTEAARDGRTR